MNLYVCELKKELLRETLSKQQWHEEYVKQVKINDKLQKENEKLKIELTFYKEIYYGNDKD